MLGPPGRGTRTILAAVALLAVPTMLLFLWPMDGDQALFHLGAQTLADGGVYYRDFWDIKQPGIFWFYVAGEAIWGQVGPRVLEVLLVLVAGAALAARLRRLHAHPLTQVLGPTLVFAPYLLLAYRAGVGQIEGLAVSLLLLHVLLTGLLEDPDDRLTEHDPRRSGPALAAWGVAGLLAGVIAVLKTMYVVLPAVLLVGAVVVLARRHAGRPAILARLAAYALGAAMPLAATLVYLVHHDVAAVAWYTSLELPGQIAALDTLAPPGSVPYLLTTAVRYLWLPALAVAVTVGALLRHPGLRRRWLPAMTTAAVVNAVFVGCVAAQYINGRRLLTLAVLLGVPALLGVDLAARRWRRPGTQGVAVLAALVYGVTATQGIVAAVRTAPLAHPTLDPATADDFAEAMTGSTARADAAPVARLVGPGSGIYVFGDPRIYRRLDARQAVPIMGWSSEFLPPPVWRELTREFACVRPGYVFVDDFSAPYLRAGGPGITALLRSDYDVLSRTPGGTWWGRSDLGPGSARSVLPPQECTPLHATW